MITLFQIDKSGSDIFEKDYSIVLIVDKKEVYGVNIPQNIKDCLINLFKGGKLNISNKSNKQRKNRFRIRFHTAVIIRLMDRAIRDLGAIDEINVELCNDIDGHFHEIKDMIFKRFNRLIPSIELEDIIQTKFQKPSFIDNVGRDFRNKDGKKLQSYNHVELDLNELIMIIKK
ncbi:hypothetical protein CMI38_02570 [Candidatus Pacearchaeota archaeon]|jgi:hypothetical protein|nr:hypothetical protein [Candidatus Pacearchaeota archaeon]|tara:strand:+ start:17572 stop:18090 length:519 start_codon:yes stop_codon:yes gene_type:complete